MAKERLYEYKTIRSRGAVINLIRMQGKENWKFHQWEGPAITPYKKDSEFSKSYYLHGVEYDAEEYSELMRDQEGLPWYKTAMGRAGENRN
tara:strand:+ start:120 stop:392 length:273 start_codon:yes stop_codon:yes gene_type:complete